VFGLPGGAILPIYDELHAFEGLRHILVRQEAAAGHAADAYARVSGKVGVVFATSGPAVTNLVTALQNAYMDSIPIVAFTGQVSTHLLGSDAFQEADNLGLTRSCTKHNFLVTRTEDIARAVKEAFHIASTGRRGPVHVDLPKDVLSREAELEYPEHVHMRAYRPRSLGHARQVRRAAEIIAASSRPVLCVGGGVIAADATAEILRLAESEQIPVPMTLMGLGAVPSNHPLSLGMLGMHGSYAANMAVYESDCLIGVGLRFDDRVTGKIDEFAPKAKIIHIDIDPASISKNIEVEVPIVGDARVVLGQLLRELATLGSARPDRSGWLSAIAAWQKAHPFSYERDETVIKPQYVIEQISDLLHEDDVVVTGVGQHQMWAAQHVGLKRPRRWCTSGGLGAMGYGLPAAIGAQVARPNARVINIDGDGSFLLSAQELATAVESQLPVKTVILDNKFHGMVRQWQELVYKKRYTAVDLTVAPDFVKLAEAYGCVGLRATRPDEVRPILEAALALREPVVVHIVVDREECVLPMVPVGNANKDMILTVPNRGDRRVAE
jgi:acetolactate synthase-1/2/3 large subunit